MPLNLELCLATTILFANFTTARAPVEQPVTVQPMAIVALDTKFDDELVAVADDVNYSVSREILTRHERWITNIQSFASWRSRLPSAADLTIVNPAQIPHEGEQADDRVIVVHEMDPGGISSPCSCTGCE